MHADFWHDKWERNDIGFHEGKPNALLTKHIDKLNLATKSRLFLPLCGKSLDIVWFLSKGYQVVGIELNRLAVEQLFDTLEIIPTIESVGKMMRYYTDALDIFVGDFFDLDAETLGNVDAVYDRAALVALPTNMREEYTAHLQNITHQAQQLLICFTYDQSQLPGPPFSISDEELHTHYAETYTLTLLDNQTVDGGLKGQCAAKEKAWLFR